MRLIRFLYYLAIFAIPFGLRKEIFSFTEGFHEYETIFIYGLDLLIIPIILFCLISISFEKVKTTTKNSKLYSLILFLLFSGISIIFALSKELAVYKLLRLLLAVGFGLAAGYGIRKRIINLEGAFWSLGISAVFQSVVAFLQFIYQKSLGLWFLGESVLGANTAGVAKVAVAGGKLIRAYGTMPHPNILAAFLIIGLLSLIYLALKLPITNSQLPKKQQVLKWSCIGARTLVLFGIFFVINGLILTFSRSGWLVAMFLAAIIFGVFLYQIFNIKYQKNGLEFRNLKINRRLFSERSREITIVIVLLLSFLSNFLIFKDFILARGHISKTEVSVTQRISYNEMALEIIKNKPWGVGIGNQVFYAVKNGVYQKFGMDKAWMWEPIHNLYLLIAVEAGTLGLIMFLVFVFYLLITNKKLIFGNWELVIGNLILIALMLLALFDHYLWTLWPGMLMLWLAIGILIGSTSAHSSMDRAQASEA